MLLDDPSPLVRRALAEVFASAQKAPPTVVHALAADQPDVALPILERSPLLLDADLVELSPRASRSADRHRRPRDAVACSVPPRSPKSVRRRPASCCWKTTTPKSRRSRSTASSSASAILPPIRENLVGRADLPVATRQALVVKLSQTLADFVTARAMARAGARRIAAARPARRRPSRSPPRRLRGGAAR